MQILVNAPIFVETIQNLNEIWIKGHLFGKVNILAYQKSPDPCNKAIHPEELGQPPYNKGRMPLVFIGRDTRASSPHLME